MRFSCHPTLFARAVHHASRLVAAKAPQEILRCLWIGTGDGEVQVVGVGKGTVSSRFSATVERAGAVVVEAQILKPLLTTLDGEVLDVAVDPATMVVTLTTDRQSVAHVQGSDPAEYVSVPPLEGAAVALPAAVFRSLVRQVAVAAAREHSKPVYEGIHLRSVATGLELTATDGYRLASEIVRLPEVPPIDALVPMMTLQTVTQILGDADGETVDVVDMSATRGQIGLRSGQVTAVLPVIVGETFPDWRSRLPTPDQCTTHLTADRQRLVTAVRRAIVVANPDAAMAFEVVSRDDAAAMGSIRLRAERSAVATLQEEVPVNLTGPAVSVFLRARLLLDLLDVLPSSTVHLHLTTGTRPLLITHDGSETYLGVLMPLAPST